MGLLFPVGAATSDRVIGAAIRVHRALGPGLLESAYQACLVRELELDGAEVRAEVEIPVRYRGVEVKAGFRADLIVDSVIIVEVKSVAKLIPIHEAQLLTYLRLSGYKLGLLMNFNVRFLKDGIRRRIL